LSDLLFVKYVERVLFGPNHFSTTPRCAQTRPILFEDLRFKAVTGQRTA